MRQKSVFSLIALLGVLFCFQNCGGPRMGSVVSSSSSTPPATLTDKPISAGTFSTCAIIKGAVKCWGGREPEVTLFPSGGQAISAGTYHECAIVSGALHCWIAPGVYGTGRRPRRLIASNVEKISMSNGAYCAILKNGDLMCAGRGYTTESDVFKTPIKFLSGVSQVSVGNDHGCAVVSSALWCWGLNNSGQLGDGTKTSSATPKEIIASGVTSVSAGISNTCAIVNGAAVCWGANYGSQLGDGTTTDRLAPGTPIIASGVTAVQSGYSSTCALANSSVYCWGHKLSETFGGTGVIESAIPKLVLSGGVETLSMTYRMHACAVRNGDIYCWGGNEYGQLGDGTTTPSATPKLIKTDIY